MGDSSSTPMKMVQGHILGSLCSKLSETKMPYQLDLEVKDRKPSIIPKVGDKVKIKSKEWYEKWKDFEGDVDVPLFFVPEMKGCCGQILEVRNIDDNSFRLKGAIFEFSLEMFEEVYPVAPAIHSSSSELVLSKDAIEKLAKQISSLTCKCDTSLSKCISASPKLQLVKSRPLLKLKKL